MGKSINFLNIIFLLTILSSIYYGFEISSKIFFSLYLKELTLLSFLKAFSLLIISHYTFTYNLIPFITSLFFIYKIKKIENYLNKNKINEVLNRLSLKLSFITIIFLPIIGILLLIFKYKLKKLIKDFSKENLFKNLLLISLIIFSIATTYLFYLKYLSIINLLIFKIYEMTGLVIYVSYKIKDAGFHSILSGVSNTIIFIFILIFSILTIKLIENISLKNLSSFLLKFLSLFSFYLILISLDFFIPIAFSQLPVILINKGIVTKIIFEIFFFNSVFFLTLFLAGMLMFFSTKFLKLNYKLKLLGTFSLISSFIFLILIKFSLLIIIFKMIKLREFEFILSFPLITSSSFDSIILFSFLLFSFSFLFYLIFNKFSLISKILIYLGILIFSFTLIFYSFNVLNYNVTFLLSLFEKNNISFYWKLYKFIGNTHIFFEIISSLLIFSFSLFIILILFINLKNRLLKIILS